jgi:dihydropteroate synthase
MVDGVAAGPRGSPETGGMMPTMDILRLGTHELRLGGVTHVMAVINLSPESKNRRSVAESPSAALAMANAYREAGASIIDLGGQSSHYENETIPWEREAERLIPTVRMLVAEGFAVSVDTWKPEVARLCVEEGAVLVNDTGGLTDPGMRAVVADSGLAAIVMYIEGDHPHAVGEVEIREDKASATALWMQGRLDELASIGITETILDPGIAINYRGDYLAYTAMQLDVIRRLHRIKDLGRPVLVPIPRKQEDHRVAAYITMALEHEADLIRVHDVEMACDLASLFGRLPDAPS